MSRPTLTPSAPAAPYTGRLAYVLVPTAAIALACGGGGGSSGPSTPPTGDETVSTPPVQPPPSSGETAVLPETAAAPSQVPAWVGSLCQTPQVLDAEDLFREALSTPEGGLEGGLLLCDVALSSTPPKGRHWDVFGNPPDPHVALTVGDASALPGACAGDVQQAVLFWSQVSLSVNTKIKLNVQDLDINRHDFAGADLTIFEGRFPLDLQGEHFRASCRALSASAVKARLLERLAEARRRLKALRGAMQPQPTAADLGFPATEEYALRRQIEDVAGHVGWMDEQVGGLLADRVSVWADWDRLARAAVVQEAQKAPTDVTLDGGLSLRVLSAQCASVCEVRVQVQNTGSQPAVLREQGTLAAVREDGWDVPLTTSDDTPTTEDGLVQVAPGATLEIGLVESVSLEGLRPPRGTTPIRLLRAGTTLVRLP